ncbi:MAG TPA: hypothetical protein ENI87_02460 [bacterium]|nr:hypothetical protein [bacterium]
MTRAWLVTLAFGGVLLAQEPELPQGLGEPEPGLPEGLGEQAEPVDPVSSVSPVERSPMDWPGTAFFADLGLTGFLDVRAGTRVTSDRYERSASLAEARLRLEYEDEFDPFVVRVAADLVADALYDSWTPEPESGRGFIDLREASVATTPLPFLDVKVGRQVLTWGTGDLLFLNDLFPKDWVSFFVGRDTEYLKAPSDAVRVGAYGGVANLEVVYTPRFDSDRYLTGERVSYFNPLLGRRSGRDAIQRPIVPDDFGRDDEIAARLSGDVRGFELAAYGYWGRWKSPGGLDVATGAATFPRLNVYGASARTQLAGGIANVEVGYYDSRQDVGGGNPFVNNSEFRVLVGYERDLPELAESLTVGVQYYVENLIGYGAYRSTLPVGIPPRDESRHVITMRITKLLLEQRLRVSLFGYVSPSDADAYLRPNVTYAIDDDWSVTVGGNVFFGEDDHTFFGQFENNSNVFVAARLSF